MTRSSLFLAASALAFSLGGCMSMEGDTDDDMTTAGRTSSAMANPMVGGAEMFPNRTIVQNASASADHTTLVAAVKAAGLVDTLSGRGPFTVFAPTNEAFSRLPAGVVDTLLKPENKSMLTSGLTYHVVSGNLTASDIMSRIRAGGGTATLRTVQGGSLRAMMEGENIVLMGGRGSKAYVTQGDVRQSNGVVHVVNGVLLPG